MSDRRVFGNMGDVDLDLGGVAPAAAPRGAPGKSTLTSRLGSVVILRKEDGTSERLRRGDDGEQAVARAASSTGAPLPGAVRDRFESSLGADLSAVRVHTGAESRAAAESVGARAYAVGNDVHFAGGQYQPDDPFGLHLLAHEVAHTQQQAGGAPVTQHKLAVSSAGDAAEHEADRAADAMVAGDRFRVSAAPAQIARRGTEAVGGETDMAVPLSDARIAPGTDNDQMVQPGQRGYSEVLVTQTIPEQEGDIADQAGEKDQFLGGVVMESGDLDKQIQKQAKLVGAYETQAEENHLFAGTDRNEANKKQLDMLYAQREEISIKVAAFNNWKVLPNSAVMALGRLDRMAMMLGASDESSMAGAIRKGVADAKALIGAAQKDKHDGGDTTALEQLEDAIPEQKDITSSLGECDTALGELNVAQGELRAGMLEEEADKEDKSAADARKRKAEIVQLKADLQAACSALDGSVAAVNAAPGKLHQMATSVNNTRASMGAKKELTKNAARAQSGHVDKMTVAYDFEEDWASLAAGHGALDSATAAQFAAPKSPLLDQTTSIADIPKLPTDVGSLISAGAGVVMDFAFANEMREINNKLNTVAAKVAALKAMGCALKSENILQNFRVKLMAFSRAMSNAENELKAAQKKYVEFGERLDVLARQLGKKGKGTGPTPDAKDEHFAMIFAGAGALKGVAAFSSQAGKSSGKTGNAGAAKDAGAGLYQFSPDEIMQWKIKLKQERRRIKEKLPDAPVVPMGGELAVIEQMYSFVRNWTEMQPRVDRCAGLSSEVDALLATLRADK